MIICPIPPYRPIIVVVILAAAKALKDSIKKGMF